MRNILIEKRVLYVIIFKGDFMKNNIFNFATSELSQDAFLCWCLNWMNDDRNIKLKEMAKKLVFELVGISDIKSLKVYNQFSKDIFVNKEKLSIKIDILVIINNETAIIIEDKTYTSEHDNQIERYKKGLFELNKTDNNLNINNIVTVYLKTGFLYDEDKCVSADKIISGYDLLNLLIPYKDESEILSNYIEYLETNLKWYDEHKTYCTDSDDFWEWNISKHQIAQYTLMRDIFPENLWCDKKSWLYRVYHGTSFGRPWTQMVVFSNYYDASSDIFEIFWRIDTDNSGPYISLRFYDDFNKLDDYKKSRHSSLYDKFIIILKKIIDECKDVNLSWNDVYPGYRGGYKESALLRIHLSKALLEWDKNKGEIISLISKINNKFLKEIKNTNT